MLGGLRMTPAPAGSRSPVIDIPRLPALAAFCVLLGACGGARDVGGATGDGVCTGCHGDATRASNRAAPPRDAHGGSESAAVGAHLAHLVDGRVTCETCHLVPSSVGSPGHFDGGTAEITFGAAAKRGGASPTYDPQTRTCSDTYCHGNFRNGNAAGSPTWTATPGQSTCGSCHSPQWAGFGGTTDAHSLHAPRGVCWDCHGGAPDCSECHVSYSYATIPPTVNRALHVNGVVDVWADPWVGWNAGTRTCNSSCHAFHGASSDAGW
jgi:predicted CxxxxCH...CXXCH cytochrome family protein